MVYIREAHPKDGWAVKGWSAVNDPETFEERTKTTLMAVKELDIKYDAVVDGMNDKVAVQYAGWPERLFVVGTDGKVKYTGGQGPWGFHPTKEFRNPMANPKRQPKNLPKKLKKIMKAGPCLETWLKKQS